MEIVNKIKNWMSKRNYAVSHFERITTPKPVYNTFSIQKAVAEGYKSNVWVYRSINLVVKNLAVIPWRVIDENGETVPDHHLTQLIKKPNQYISKNDMFELFFSWLELAGNAYAIKVKTLNGFDTQQTVELWPVSPDRIAPMRGTKITDWVQGYKVDPQTRYPQSFKTDEILHLKFFNPADPLIGIGPLQAAAKVVDIDNDQLDWSKSTMQNRGVIEGVFTFERPFESLDDAEAIREELENKFGGRNNGRKFAVLGSNAKYTRIAMTPAESDFATSRKDNRDEIFLAFGIPPQLGGSMESSTYNNFETSLLIFWFSTLIPILDDIRESFNFTFDDELAEGEKLSYDLSGVQAIRKAMLDRAETAEKMFAMGVPFSQINRIFEMGVDEYEGWEKSYVKVTQSGLTPTEDIGKDNQDDTRSEKQPTKFTLAEYRAEDTQDQIEKLAIQNAKTFEKLLADQQKQVFTKLDNTGSVDIDNILDDTKSDWENAIRNIFLTDGVNAGLKIIVERRAAKDILTGAMNKYLDDELLVLMTLSELSKTTAENVIAQVSDGLEQGLTMNDIQQNLIDSGTFTPARALMLARTLTGNAVNLGQLQGALTTGATHKTWITARFEVRDTHKAMEGVKKPINEMFTVGGARARYPLDNALPPGERCNCRCTMTFSIET